jgi:hypothetical protein
MEIEYVIAFPHRQDNTLIYQNVYQAGHTAELRFIYARLAYRRLQAALFDDAGSLFQKSKIDPRFVISLFPKYVGNSIPQDQELAIWQGLTPSLDETTTIEAIGQYSVSYLEVSS